VNHVRRGPCLLAGALVSLSLAAGVARADTVPNCAPETVLAAASGARNVLLERAITYYDLRPNYSQSECVNLENGDKKPAEGASCEAPLWWRTDCSGFVSSVWRLSGSFGTGVLAYGGKDAHGTSWAEKGWADLEPGDAINRPNDHVALFTGWLDEKKTSFCVFEEYGVGMTDEYGGLGCIVDTYGVSMAKSDGFTPLGLTALPDEFLDGAIESANCDGIAGWSIDRAEQDSPVGVDLYVGAAFGDPKATVLGRVSVGGDHTFAFPISKSLRDGKPRIVYAYAHRATPGSTLTRLAGTPITLTCSKPIEEGSTASSSAATGAGGSSASSSAATTGGGSAAGNNVDAEPPSEASCAIASHGADGNSVAFALTALAIIATRRGKGRRSPLFAKFAK
jgi:hypothetical protein